MITSGNKNNPFWICLTTVIRHVNNIIWADQKDFKYTAVKTEIEKAQSIVDLYTFAKEFIPILELSKNAICYYADLAEQFGRSRSGQFVTHCPDCHKNNLDDDHLDRGYC